MNNGAKKEFDGKVRRRLDRGLSEVLQALETSLMITALKRRQAQPPKLPTSLLAETVEYQMESGRQTASCHVCQRRMLESFHTTRDDRPASAASFDPGGNA